ncbi:MAG: 50S ribosomal protein L1 [Elusimicrobia bacterium]|nr:50S ribosomal protein L1 [Elusimicrobiota bacterium]
MGKRLVELEKAVEKGKAYSLPEAVALVKKTAKAKFDETIEIHIRLGIDPKQSDQQLRGTLLLPNGSGKSSRVAVVAKGEKMKEAESAGADVVGAEDLVEKIGKGWLEFDVLVATPDVMKEVMRLGKLLGPKGLMPNPKSGTVTFELGKTVKELKAGRLEFKADAYGIVHLPMGKASFSAEKLLENAQMALEVLSKARPSGAKGKYILSVFLSSSMGPGIPVAAASQE